MSVPVPNPHIDFASRETEPSRYKFLPISLNNQAGNIITLQASTTQMLEWKLPTTWAYNLSKSHIAYVGNVPAQGAGNFGWIHDGVANWVSSITFGGAGGDNLVDLQYANNYSKHALKLNTPLEKMTTAAGLEPLSRFNGTAATNYVPGGVGTTQVASDSYLEPAYARVSVNGAGVATANTALAVSKQMPLSVFSGTLFGVDRDFYSPVEQYLRIQAGTGDKFAYTTPSATDPTTAGATLVPQATLSGLVLFLAVEQNENVNEVLRGWCKAGQLKYRIPFTQAFKIIGGPAGSMSTVPIALSKQYGDRLKKVMATIYEPSETYGQAYNCDNTLGKKIASFQTFFESKPMQDRVLSCAASTATQVNFDDWVENKKFCGKNSSITSRECYQANWFHIDQFYEPHKDDTRSLPDANLIEGLPMDTNKTWNITCTNGTVANCQHYIFAEYSREVLVTPAMGAQLLPNMIQPLV